MSANLTKATASSNVSFTLPITCQICLGKVKEPVICPNLHVFCAFCIDIWLEKNKQCPTCRIPITLETPVKRILGGYDSKDDQLIPTEFSHSSTRKARFYSIFQQYEDEISRLLKQIDTLTSEVAILKEMNNDPNRFNNNSNNINSATNGGGGSPQHDMIQMLKTKLSQTQSNYDELYKERDKLKELNKKLDNDNSLLMQDIQRLKINISETKAQLSSRYTVAALESKIENYEKEIKQLQKALEKSDKYILELENNQQNQQQDFQFIKNELKPIDNQNNYKNNNNELMQQANKLTNAISNDKFYGSPIKTLKYCETLPTNANSTNANNNNNNNNSKKHIETFAERLKKSSFDLELPSPLTQSFNNHTDTPTITAVTSHVEDAQKIDTQTIQQPLSSSTTATTATATPATSSSNNTRDYINSPMKRLRLDEFHLERPKQDLNNSVTSEFNDCLQLLNEAETKVNNRGLVTSPKLLSIPSTSTTSTTTPTNNHHQQQQSLNSPSFTSKPNKHVNTPQIKFLLPDKYYQEILNQQQHHIHNQNLHQNGAAATGTNLNRNNRSNSNENLNFISNSSNSKQANTSQFSPSSKYDFNDFNSLFANKQKHSPPIQVDKKYTN